MSRIDGPTLTNGGGIILAMILIVLIVAVAVCIHERKR